MRASLPPALPTSGQDTATGGTVCDPCYHTVRGYFMLPQISLITTSSFHHPPQSQSPRQGIQYAKPRSMAVSMNRECRGVFAPSSY